MLIQPRYDRIEGTPLAYFKFLKVMLGIGIVVRIIRLLSLFSAEPDWYSAVYGLLDLVLTVLAFWGLKNMKWKGVLAYFGMNMLIALDRIVAIGIYVHFGEIGLCSKPLGHVLGIMVVLVLVWIYFGKRRLLFDPLPKHWQAQVPPPTQPDPYTRQAFLDETPVPEWEPGEEAPGISEESRQTGESAVRFCRSCGCELVPGSKFCSACGTKVIKEW